MRNQRTDKRLELEEYGTEDQILVWVMATRDNEYSKGFTSKDVMEKVDSHKTTTCRLLRELVEDDILSRNRVHGRWFYRIKNYHDPEEYILDKRARTLIIRKYAAFAAGNARLKQKNEKLLKFGRKHDLFVSCECGRRMGFKVKLEEIDDSSKRCDEGDGTLIPTDSVLGLPRS